MRILNNILTALFIVAVFSACNEESDLNKLKRLTKEIFSLNCFPDKKYEDLYNDEVWKHIETNCSAEEIKILLSSRECMLAECKNGKKDSELAKFCGTNEGAMKKKLSKKCFDI